MLGKLLYQKCKLSFFVQYMLRFLSQNKFCTKEKKNTCNYNAFNVYCRVLAPGTISLTGDRAQGDDSKH